MADLPFVFESEGFFDRLMRSLDSEGKLPRALDALAPMRDRDVVLLDGGQGQRARQLAGLGARVTALERPTVFERLAAGLADTPGLRALPGDPSATGLPPASADVVVGFWSAIRAMGEAEIAEADRILRPDGRLLVVHDYGRDDVTRLRPDGGAEYVAWSRRDGWFLRSGFKVRVVHCWWTFESVDEAREFLSDAFGDAGAAVAADLRRPRLSHNLAVYHRVAGASPGIGSVAAAT